jgi:uncharacterized protein (DUF433 family)
MLERIEVNPRKLAGKAVVRGTRIPVYLILELLENGYTFKKIIEAYPVLTEEDIKAAIEYSAKLLKNEEVVEYGVT